jgi:hypothetical protein
VWFFCSPIPGKVSPIILGFGLRFVLGCAYNGACARDTSGTLGGLIMNDYLTVEYETVGDCAISGVVVADLQAGGRGVEYGEMVVDVDGGEWFIVDARPLEDHLWRFSGVARSVWECLLMAEENLGGL